MQQSGEEIPDAEASVEILEEVPDAVTEIQEQEPFEENVPENHEEYPTTADSKEEELQTQETTHDDIEGIRLEMAAHAKDTEVIIPEPQEQETEDDNKVDSDEEDTNQGSEGVEVAVAEEDDDVIVKLCVTEETVHSVQDVVVAEKECEASDNEDFFEDAKSSTLEDNGRRSAAEDLDNGGDEKMETDEAECAEEKPPPLVVEPARSSVEAADKPEPEDDQRSTAARKPRGSRSHSSKRDHLRRRRDRSSGPGDNKKGDDHPSLDETSRKSSKNLRLRIKERDRSESPLVHTFTTTDDDTTSDVVVVGMGPRDGRRYSSTPAIDSVPSSPASTIGAETTEREYKNWKKTILIAYNQFATLHYKYSAILLVPEELRHICKRPMDMQLIKKNIDSGVIRTTAEFQRDVLLMVQNAIMMNTRRDRDWLHLLKEMQAEVEYWRRETEKNLTPGKDASGSGYGSATGGGNGSGERSGRSRESGKIRHRKSKRFTTTTTSSTTTNSSH